MTKNRLFHRHIVEDDVRSICRQLAVGAVTAGIIGIFLDPDNSINALGPIATGVLFIYYGVTTKREDDK